MIQKIIIISFHHVDWSVSLPLSHGIIFRRPSALDKLGAVLFQHGEAVYSLVLLTGQHYFPTLAVTPGRIGQQLWTRSGEELCVGLEEVLGLVVPLASQPCHPLSGREATTFESVSTIPA
ncbi:unnamed protein product [Caenorhabditis auriculariae]|uniref:Uncharacterized protein n=1 Tax=Caenorhabditis auriculariae TaxID=2777116 RepID=A0A8S1H449_9PELO|nr:unnamed protein product [Caenorhabditis auriculariae]